MNEEYKIDKEGRAIIPCEDYILFVCGLANDGMKEKLKKAKCKLKRKVTHGRNSNREV